MTLATRQTVLLDLFVDEEEWRGHFDKLEVWRCREPDGGPYEELTGDEWQPARLPTNLPESTLALLESTPGPHVNLVDRVLELLVYETVPLTITFTGPDPLTWAEAAAQVEAGSQGLLRAFHASFGLVGWLVLETRAPGQSALLRVVGGDAAPLLGLPTTEPDSIAFGRDARIPLLPGQTRYVFSDPNGAVGYLYKVRCYSTSTRTTSAFSPPFNAPPIARLSPAALVRGTVRLVDGAGNPIANRTVLVHLGLQGKPVEGRVVAGGPMRQTTDQDGRAEFLLVRGTSITVAVAGTDLARSLEVPTDPAIETFDLLDPALGQDDLFNVQRPEIAYAVRRSL